MRGRKKINGNKQKLTGSVEGGRCDPVGERINESSHRHLLMELLMWAIVKGDGAGRGHVSHNGSSRRDGRSARLRLVGIDGRGDHFTLW